MTLLYFVLPVSVRFVHQLCDIREFYAAYVGNFSLTFRENVSIPLEYRNYRLYRNVDNQIPTYAA